MTDEQDDLTLVYAYGFKLGQDSMKAEIDRLRDDNIALRELRAELILRALDESAAEIKRLRAFVEAVVRYAGNAGDDYLADQARAELAGETRNDGPR